MVRKGGLEPPRAAPLEPKSSASTNSATFAAAFAERASIADPMAFPASADASAGGVGVCRKRITFGAFVAAVACPSPITKIFRSPRSLRAQRAASGRGRDLPLRPQRRRPRRRGRRCPPRSGWRRCDRYERALDAIGERARRRRSRRSRTSPRPSRATRCRSAPFRDLLSAFRQDVTTTRYADYADAARLLPPLGQSGRPAAAAPLRRATRRRTARAATRSARALQLVNFWQDVAVGLAARAASTCRGEDLARFGVDRGRRSRDATLRRRLARADGLRDRARARALLESGRPLTRALPLARCGWNSSGVLAGGHRILDGIDARRRRRLPPAAAARGPATGSPSPATPLLPRRRHLRAAHVDMTPDEYCQQRAAQSGSSFYYSFLFLPPERRRAITALYAFCREVDDVVDEVTDPGVARSQARVVAQRDRRRVRRHAAAPGGAGAAAGGRAPIALPQEHFQAVIDGMAMDLERSRYLDFADLERYCHRVAGRRRPPVGRDLRLQPAGHARLRARPRHRLPAHQHHPRRRRGRAPRPHLPAAGRPRAARRHRVGAAAAHESADASAR